jgi:citrate lyase subunit beta/citryl-CoA lyase
MGPGLARLNSLDDDMPHRSYLFVPGDRPERFDKAIATGAHVTIIDLEDAVLPERKVQARAALLAWLAQTRRRVMVRINPSGTPWYEEDCGVLQQPAVAGVMVPKAQDAGQLASLAQSLREGQAVVPLVESVAGHFAAAQLARVPRVARLAFGSFDFMSDAGIRGDAEELDAVRTHLVLVSRHAGIAAPVDGVTLATDNVPQIERDVARSRRYGMGGKLCIHPRQVPLVNAGFAPSAQEVDWARRVVSALAQGQPGAVAVDGKLVDRPIELMARAILGEMGQ